MKVYIGKVQYGIKNGLETLIVETNSGNVEVPLSEALVDPIQKEDFDQL